MISAEQLINDLRAQVSKLQEELTDSEQNVRDFEKLAQTWKKSYGEEVKRLKIRITNLEQTVESLEEELSQARKHRQSP